MIHLLLVSSLLELRLQEIFKRLLGDSVLYSISWDGDDLILDLIPPNNSLPTGHCELRFTTVSHLLITLDYGNYSGQPLVFSAQANETENHRWTVLFEFGVAPEGVISFECNEILEDTISK